MKMTFSIVTPVLNRLELLPKMIESVLIQSFIDFELLIQRGGGWHFGAI